MIATLSKRLQFARSFQSRRFTMLWIGQTISNLGDGMFTIALAWQVLLMTHSGISMAIVLIATIIPRLVFSLLGGVAADRLPRRLIILWSDGGRGAIVLLISILGFLGHLQLWHLVVEALIFGVVDGFFNPAIMAITPDLVDKDDLGSANSLNSLSSTLARLLGPMLGAVLIALTGPMGAFAADGISFFLSVGFLLSVNIPEQHVTSVPEVQAVVDGSIVESAEPASKRGFQGVVADVREGLVYVRSSRWIWITILNAALSNIGLVAALTVAMPKLVADVYGQGAWLLGLIGIADPIGAFLALPLIGIATRMQKRGLLAYLGLGVTSIGIIIFGLPFPRAAAPFIAPLASILVGFGLTFMNTIWITLLHETVPTKKLGRVLSLDMLASFATIPLGEAIGGIMADRVGPAQVFLLFGIVNLIDVVILLLIRDVRELK